MLFAESREVLIVGGQVKSADLSRGKLRQRGIEEINGVEIVSPICVRSIRLEEPTTREFLVNFISQPECSRKSPIFVEICLDAQNKPAKSDGSQNMKSSIVATPSDSAVEPVSEMIAKLVDLINVSHRPVLLLGSGVRIESIQG